MKNPPFVGIHWKSKSLFWGDDLEGSREFIIPDTNSLHLEIDGFYVYEGNPFHIYILGYLLGMFQGSVGIF